jgi:uncharacterized protein YaaN involved in tellurite resistance
MAIVDQFLALLKKAGVEVEGDALATVKSGVESWKLAEADNVVGSDEIAIKTSDYNDMKKNLRELRTGKKELEGQLEDLGRTAESQKAELDKVKTVAERLQGEATERWERLSKGLPGDDDKSERAEKIRGLFKKPEKEGEKLSMDDVLSNIAEYNKLADLGVLGGDKDGAPNPPPTPRPGDKPGSSALRNKSIDERLNSLYANQDNVGPKGAQDNR